MNAQDTPGFIVTMSDHTRYLIPLEVGLKLEVADIMSMKADIEAEDEDGKKVTRKRARKWAEERLVSTLRRSDMEEIFAGTHWSKIGKHAIKIPPLAGDPDEMWADAEITFNMDCLPEFDPNRPLVKLLKSGFSE